MKKKIKISFIGAGFMSQIAHIINFRKNKRVQLWDIADYDYKMAYGVKKKFGFKGFATDDADKVIKNKPDGIVIIVQRPLMTDLIKKSFKGNLNVLSEKPPTYSYSEYVSCKRLAGKKIWIKGYNRRCDPVVRYLKKNINKFHQNFGDLLNVKYEIMLGNSYMGEKHKIRPTLKKKIWKGVKNKFPHWLKTKNKKLYEYHLNSACHYFDLFDFFKIEPTKNFNSFINSDTFKSSFVAKFKKNTPYCELLITNSRVYGWEENLIFYFRNGSCRINFQAPLNKKESHKLFVTNGKSGKVKIISKKNINSFDEQSKIYIDLILKSKNKDYTDFKGGENSIKFYEKVWNNYQNKSL